jgi:predicted 3-demethylubiquinone-9 3-methyltransferase (glyoxalase superfamily)
LTRHRRAAKRHQLVSRTRDVEVATADTGWPDGAHPGGIVTGVRRLGGCRACRRPTTVVAVAHQVRTFLTFQGGVATAALDLYRTVFEDFELLNIAHYGPDGPGPQGTIMVAQFRLAGGEFSCADSPVDHSWGFTPAVSLWIECADEAEQQQRFDRLSADGVVYMPLDDYGFSSRFGWAGDRFGVTWQLNLE